MTKKLNLKTLSVSIVLLVISAIIIFLFYQYSNLFFSSYAQGKVVPLVANTPVIYRQEKVGPTFPVGFGVPVNISIPQINVDALVDSVGLTPEGAVGIPKGPSTVAWFNQGPFPGSIGNSIMSGHYGWNNGKAAVFDDLHLLKKGAKIYVKDGRGVVTTFVVREIKKYGLDADASLVFNSADNSSHLNLITCEGVWDEASKSYSKRLVVFADKQ